MARVVSASAVTKGLEKHGWRQAESADGSLVVCKGKSRITFGLHPSRPDMVYLFDLLERLPEVPDDLSQAAVDETLQEIAGFMPYTTRQIAKNITLQDGSRSLYGVDGSPAVSDVSTPMVLSVPPTQRRPSPKGVPAVA